MRDDGEWCITSNVFFDTTLTLISAGNGQSDTKHAMIAKVQRPKGAGRSITIIVSDTLGHREVGMRVEFFTNIPHVLRGFAGSLVNQLPDGRFTGDHAQGRCTVCLTAFPSSTRSTRGEST